MTRLIAILMVLAVTGCGVDGPPTPPAAKAKDAVTRSSVRISGEARFGISGNLN